MNRTIKAKIIVIVIAITFKNKIIDTGGSIYFFRFPEVV